MHHSSVALWGASLSILAACSSASDRPVSHSTQADTIPSDWPTPTVNLPGMRIPDWSATTWIGDGGQCLAADGTGNGAHVRLAACDGSAAQEWRIDMGWGPFDGNRDFVIHGPGGRCLDVAGASSADGTAVQLWDCIPGATNQEWGFAGAAIVGLGSTCLEGNSSGAQMDDCSGESPQRWKRNPDGPPSLSGKVYLSDLPWMYALSTQWTPNGLATAADVVTLDHAVSLTPTTRRSRSTANRSSRE